MRKKYLARPFALKAVNDDGTFEGYGSVFHVEDSYKEVVVPGAFEKSLAEYRKKGRLPAMLWQHDARSPIGVYDDMREDDRGLYVKGRLLKDDVAMAREAYALLKAGAVSGLSIGYRTIIDEYDRETGITTLKELDLWEVSAVTFPANDEARVDNVKSITTRRDFEKFLRESGFSKSQAVRIASRGFERRESAEDAELIKLLRDNISILGG